MNAQFGVRARLFGIALAIAAAAACGMVIGPEGWNFRIKYQESRGGLPLYPKPGQRLDGDFIAWASNDPNQQHATEEEFSGTSDRIGMVYSTFGKWPAAWQVTPIGGPCNNQSRETIIWFYRETRDSVCTLVGGSGFNYDSGTDGYIDSGGTQSAAAADSGGEYPIVPTSGESETLPPDTFLYGDDYVDSVNNGFRLIMQLDGNLVLYQGSQPIWNTGTVSGNPGWAVMQADGNLVVYNGSNVPIWATGTAGNSGAYLAVLDNGTLMLFNSSGYPLWFSNSGS